MKLLALAILLVMVCCLEGAFVKREAEAQAPSQVPDVAAIFKEYAQTLSQYVATVGLTEEKAEELKAQAQTFFAQAQEKVKPITDQLNTFFIQSLEKLKESIQGTTSS